MTEPRADSAVELEDLSIRARRGELRADEQRALERALSTQPTLRVAHQVGRDFDQQLRVRAGDDELVLRASSRALEQRRPSSRLSVALAAGLAAVLIASVVAARLLWTSFQGPTESKIESQARPMRQASQIQRSLSPPAPASVAPLPAPSPDSRPSSPSAPRVGMAPPIPRDAKALPSAQSDAETAASLFREAGVARRAGDLTLARSRYAELQAKFPNTNEARVSRVSLGKLLLAAGRAREAEREFSAYQAEGGGVLGEEALVGRAEALAQLGESGEERRVWQELLRTHGSSVYAERARQRLQALQSAGESSSH